MSLIHSFIPFAHPRNPPRLLACLRARWSPRPLERISFPFHLHLRSARNGLPVAPARTQTYGSRPGACLGWAVSRTKQAAQAAAAGFTFRGVLRFLHSFVILRNHLTLSDSMPGTSLPHSPSNERGRSDISSQRPPLLSPGIALLRPNPHGTQRPRPMRPSDASGSSCPHLLSSPNPQYRADSMQCVVRSVSRLTALFFPIQSGTRPLSIANVHRHKGHHNNEG